MKRRVAGFLDRFRYGFLLQSLACAVLGHEPITAASWHVTAKGMRCAYCGADA